MGVGVEKVTDSITRNVYVLSMAAIVIIVIVVILASSMIV
jgi:hypothetical protein